MFASFLMRLVMIIYLCSSYPNFTEYLSKNYCSKTMLYCLFT